MPGRRPRRPESSERAADDGTDTLYVPAPAPNCGGARSTKDKRCPAVIPVSTEERKGTVDVPLRRVDATGGRVMCLYGPTPGPGFHWRGRALRGPGGVLLAGPTERGDWRGESTLAGDLALDEDVRRALAEVWLRDAAFERLSCRVRVRSSKDRLEHRRARRGTARASLGACSSFYRRCSTSSSARIRGASCCSPRQSRGDRAVHADGAGDARTASQGSRCSSSAA